MPAPLDLDFEREAQEGADQHDAPELEQARQARLDRNGVDFDRRTIRIVAGLRASRRKPSLRLISYLSMAAPEHRCRAIANCLVRPMVIGARIAATGLSSA